MYVTLYIKNKRHRRVYFRSLILVFYGSDLDIHAFIFHIQIYIHVYNCLFDFIILKLNSGIALYTL